MPDISLLSIEKAIIHYVPNCQNPDIQPILNDSLLILEDEARETLAARITGVLGRGTNCLEMRIADTTETSTASEITNILNDPLNDENFITKTKSLARKLYLAQSSGRISEGILLCILGRSGQSQQQFVALIKAEKQTGFHIDTERLLNVEFIQDLFLTDSQKLYKVAFWSRSTTSMPISVNDLQIHIFDQNATHTGTVKAATYFSQNFSGCAPLENTAYQTEQFYSKTKNFINANESIADSEKVTLINSLHTYLKSDQSTVINTQEFATTYFQNDELTNQYLSRMRHERFPETAINKNIERISTKLRNRKISFNTGVKISFPSQGDSGDLFRVDGYDSSTNYTTICIKGKMNSQDS